MTASGAGPQRDDLFFLLRWLFILAIAGLVLITRAQTPSDEGSVDLAAALLLMSAANGAFFPFVQFTRLRRAATPAALVTDVLIAIAALAVAEGEPWLVFAVGLSMPIIGLARSSFVFSTSQIVLVEGLVLAALMVDRGPESLAFLILPLGVLGVVAALAGGTAFALQRRPLLHTPVEVVEAHREARESRASDRARSRALYDLALALSSTLDYRKILQAALEAGRIVLRLELDAERELRAAVLLIAPEDGQLHVVASRRFTVKDEEYAIPGKRGVVADALRSSEPVVSARPGEDPELQYFAALQYCKSLLCIPLHSGLDNFGVVIYGVDKSNAFNDEQTDLMTSIGVQATLALQNALLYESLLQEKERIISVEEDARKKLARDLHDGPTQTISAISMRVPIIQSLLLNGQPERAGDELRKVSDLALKTTREIRHMLFTLRPLVLETRGLEAALVQLADKTRDTYGQLVEVRLTADVEAHLDTQQQGVLFYIIEEAVNNARKHAEAGVIVISGGRQGQQIAVHITDDGRGFESAGVTIGYDRRGSLGMVNMRERAELIDGLLEVESTPGHGTRVTVRIPLRSSNVNPDDDGRIRPLTKLAQAAAERASASQP
ncbi:MAG TPA: GAF domain-containing sensor histidine kinase [Candidatus Limnocylindrales bacterium]|nr:GAF domain-containing sensor histidine kinase [Candidatus Limnocylindrales bacterium]